MNDRSTWTPGELWLATQAHLVQFYDTETELCRSAADYLAEGARGGEKLVLLATAAHQDVIIAKLEEQGIDAQSARRVDPVDLLPMLSRDPKELAELLRQQVLPTTDAPAAGTVPIRVYGELADLLLRNGQLDLALALEDLWTDVTASQVVSVLCAHSLENFYQDTTGRTLYEICQRHGRALADL